jgi:hypothetical protein
MESKFLQYFLEFMIHDWFASIPITICSVLTIAVTVERYMYYQQNRRDVTQFIHTLQDIWKPTTYKRRKNLAANWAVLLAKLLKKAFA